MIDQELLTKSVEGLQNDLNTCAMIIVNIKDTFYFHTPDLSNKIRNTKDTIDNLIGYINTLINSEQTAKEISLQNNSWYRKRNLSEQSTTSSPARYQSTPLPCDIPTFNIQPTSNSKLFEKSYETPISAVPSKIPISKNCQISRLNTVYLKNLIKISLPDDAILKYIKPIYNIKNYKECQNLKFYYLDDIICHHNIDNNVYYISSDKYLYYINNLGFLVNDTKYHWY